MVTKTRTLGSAKRFGARYGSRVKEKFAAAERLQRSEHKCPYCHYTKVRRQFAGVWNCGKCDATFTSKAYTVVKKPSIRVLEGEGIINYDAATETQAKTKDEAVTYKVAEHARKDIPDQDILYGQPGVTPEEEAPKAAENPLDSENFGEELEENDAQADEPSIEDAESDSAETEGKDDVEQQSEESTEEKSD